jgi:uncharacterized repeat protein (TIGR03803 family)
MTTEGAGFSILYDFPERRGGARPEGVIPSSSDRALFGTTHYGGRFDGGTVFRLPLGCEASVHVQDKVHAGRILSVAVHLAHNRPKTVTVPWELRLLDTSGQVVAKHTTAPHTFEPGDVVDRAVEFWLPDDLPADTYTLELVISGMAGTLGASTTLNVTRAE